jgi:hypothetical protein
MNRERLMNVVRALREAPPEVARRFDMHRYVHRCGTPACAFGHYAARTDLQNAFEINRDSSTAYVITSRGDVPDPLEIERHFDLNEDDHIDLLGTEGCRNAKTTTEAADYIEAFIARQDAEQADV